MSLDVYLSVMGKQDSEAGSGIFIRENGANREISRVEWDSGFPYTELVVADNDYSEETVYSRNITHNLGAMADEAGIHDHLWRPDEIGVTKAIQLIDPLTEGLRLLQSDPVRFQAFNPKNGWGDYDGLVDFVSEYLEACKTYPEADVRASR